MKPLSSQVHIGRSAIAIVLAVIGTFSIGAGAYAVLRSPHDGQLGLMLYPAWSFGAAVGLGAIAFAQQSGSKAVFRAVLTLALIAVGLIVLNVVWFLVA